MRKIYYIHPVYNLYGAAPDGTIICLSTKNIILGNKNNAGYLLVKVRSKKNKNRKSYSAHRFIYECLVGEIPKGYEIDHKNNNKTDTRLINLQLLTHSENVKKSNVGGKKVRISIRAKNLKTGEEFTFESMYKAGKKLNVNQTSIWRVCNKITNSAYSKTDQSRWYFEIILNQ